jgi:hypothetical protein
MTHSLVPGVNPLEGSPMSSCGKLRLEGTKKNPTKIDELQHMKYICDEIILVTKYKK